MNLSEATVGELQVEIARRSTEIPDGYRLVSTEEMQSGSWLLYDPSCPTPWALDFYVNDPNRLKFIDGRWPIMVVARKASDG